MRIRHIFSILLLVISVFCSGCTQNKNDEKSYSYEIKALRSDSNVSETYKVYIKGDKWREEEFENHNSKPHTIKIFNGKNVYIRSAYSGVQGYLFPEKMKDAANNFRNITVNEAKKMHTAYHLINWKQSSEEMFRKPIRPIQLGKSKSKYGYTCTTYRYIYQKIYRDICVDDKSNIAVFVINKFPSFSDEYYLVNVETKDLSNNIFSYFSILNKLTK